MKRFLISLFLCIYMSGPFISSSYAEEIQDDSYFIVTAYYSPLPDQKHYLTGNYEDEIILNGAGIAGASGKKVFSGMLAAPGKYSFGTKIYLDGLGIGEVADRGGAIVPAGQRGYSYDRIDVWMGYGEEGLQRALFWGKRKVYGYIIDSGNTANLNYENIPSPTWATTNLQQAGKINEPIIPSIFDASLTVGSDNEKIKELQQILVDLQYLSKENITGEYDSSTIGAIYDFQIKAEVVKNESDVGAGSYGPKTRKELQKLYTAYQKEQQEKEIFEGKLALIRENSFSKAEQEVIALEKPIYGEISPRVRELQKTLNLLGYFPHKDTAIFGVKTQNALLDYQYKKQLISTDSDLGAGTFGPQTRAQITKDLAERYFIENLTEKNMLEKYKNYFPEEKLVSEKEEKVSLQDIISKI